MRIISPISILALAAMLVGISYFHERAHRYGLVGVGAGGGGSQDSIGEKDVRVYLIDHQTGKIWSVEDRVIKPEIQYDCKDENSEYFHYEEMPGGCKEIRIK